jgi:hypothetical protein
MGHLKNVFSPGFGVAPSPQVLDPPGRTCGLRLGRAVTANENPIFETASNGKSSVAGSTVQDLVEGLADGRQGVGRSHTDTGNQLPGFGHPFGLRTAGGNDRFLIGMDMDDAAIGFQSVDTLTHYHNQQQRVHCLFLDPSPPMRKFEAALPL